MTSQLCMHQPRVMPSGVFNLCMHEHAALNINTSRGYEAHPLLHTNQQCSTSYVHTCTQAKRETHLVLKQALVGCVGQ